MAAKKKILKLDELTDGELEKFEKGSSVVMKVTREMTDEEFNKFSMKVGHLAQRFEKRGVMLVICPHWLDFIVVKEGETIEREMEPM